MGTGDNFDCYRPAQLQLLNMISTAPGCSIIITGDFHYSDIKVLRPGPSLYSKAYASERNAYNIFQVMASGMTTSTAQKLECSHEFRVDPTGLRDHGECDFLDDPSFGVIDVQSDVEKIKNISMHIKDGSGVTHITSYLDVQSCNPMPITCNQGTPGSC